MNDFKLMDYYYGPDKSQNVGGDILIELEIWYQSKQGLA